MAFTSPPLLAMPRRIFIGSGNSGSDLTTYSFTSQSLPSPGGDRAIVVLAGSRGASARTLASGSIAGTALDVLATHGTGNSGVGIAVAWESSSTSGTLSLTWSGAAARCYYALYAVYGLSSVAALDSGTSASMTVLTRANSLVFAAGAADAAMSVTGATEDVEETVETTFGSFSSNQFTTQSSSHAVVITTAQAGASVSFG